MTFYIKNCSERYYATVPIVMTKLFDKNNRQTNVQVEGSYLVNHSEFHKDAIEQGLGGKLAVNRELPRLYLFTVCAK